MKYLILSLVLVGILSNANAQNNSNLQTKTATDSQFTSKSRGFGEGVDKSFDTNLAKMSKTVAPQFKVSTFEDKTVNRTMEYNLFVPKDYDGSQSYPLVMFIGDGTTTGKGPLYSLTQGYGGIIWATEENQTKNPCFVLVPAFAGPGAVVNDDGEINNEVAIIPHLIEYISSQYKVDKNRIYTTGQSMGGMISFYLNIHFPDLFAASMFVSSQWDTEELSPLVNHKFLYITSAADGKAAPKMKELGEMLTKRGVSYSETEFSARLPLDEQNNMVNKILSKGDAINFVRFTPNTVMPEGKESSMAEHMYGFDRAYLLDSARDWLFKQSK